MKKLMISFFGILGFLILGSFLFSYSLLSDALSRRYGERMELFGTPRYPYESVRLHSGDGIGLSGWYIPAEAPKAAVILVHGFATYGAKAELLPHADYLHEAGYAVFLLDLRGNGESEGQGSTLGVFERRDVLAAYDALRVRPELSGKRIGFFGVSMGAATAIMAAGSSGKGDFVIADVPFADYERLFAHRVVREGYGRIPGLSSVLSLTARFFLGFDYDQFEPSRVISSIRAPIFLIWSPQDDVVGSEVGGVLFSLANEPKQEWITSFGHDTLHYGYDAYRTRVLDFLSRYAAIPSLAVQEEVPMLVR